MFLRRLLVKVCSKMWCMRWTLHVDEPNTYFSMALSAQFTELNAHVVIHGNLHWRTFYVWNILFFIYVTRYTVFIFFLTLLHLLDTFQYGILCPVFGMFHMEMPLSTVSESLLRFFLCNLTAYSYKLNNWTKFCSLENDAGPLLPSC